MAGKRQRYSAAFKAKVALEAIRGELTMAQLATEHVVHQTLIPLAELRLETGGGRRAGGGFLRQGRSRGVRA